MRPFLRLLTAGGLTGLLFGAGCSDDEGGNNGTPTPTTSFHGIFVGNADGGSMSVTISSATLAPALRSAPLQRGAGGGRILGANATASAAQAAASGSINLSGGPVVRLSGTYNGETDSLNLTGGGFTFFGAYDSTGSTDAILGGYTGPSGFGSFGVVAGNSSTIKTFCGTFTPGENWVGRINLIIGGDEVGGAASASGEPWGFEGVVTGTGNPRTITLSGEIDDSSTFTATGQWDTTADTITGTWEESNPVATISGTWEASLCE